MKLSVYRLTDQRCLQACSLDDVLDNPADQQQTCWIDVQRSDAESLAKLLVKLELHPLAIEACLDPVPASRLVTYATSLFIGLPTQSNWDAADRAFLWVVCIPGKIITVHDHAMHALDTVVQQYTQGMRFHGDGTSAILYQILDHLIDEDMAFTLRNRDAIDQLDEWLDEDDSDAMIQRVLPLKRQLTRLAATFEDQLYCVGALQTIESEAFNIEGLQDYFRDAFSHLEHADRSIARHRTHLNAIHQDYHLRLQNRTNDRLRLLTIISTIFIPLTLITGIYGMNFRHMPVIESRFGYAGVLITMIILATAMMWGFHRKGWFK